MISSTAFVNWMNLALSEYVFSESYDVVTVVRAALIELLVKSSNMLAVDSAISDDDDDEDEDDDNNCVNTSLSERSLILPNPCDDRAVPCNNSE